MGQEAEPNSQVEKSKWFNRLDEAYGLLCLSISSDILFHVESASSPNEVRTKLEGLFGKQDVLRGHQLENEIIRLSPSDFDTIQDIFKIFKFLLKHLKACGIDKKEDQLILSILSKLGPNYSVFVSTFFATKSAIGSTWKMPSLDEFAASLTDEQDKLVQMGTLKASNAHALAAKMVRNTSSSSKHKGKKYQSKEEDSTSMQDTLDSEDGKPKKGKVVCSYCKKPNHGEDVCMKK